MNTKRCKELIRYWLLQVELYTCMYVMDPTEKIIFLAVLFCILGLVFYWAWVFLQTPLYLVMNLAMTTTGIQMEPNT